MTLLVVVASVSTARAQDTQEELDLLLSSQPEDGSPNESDPTPEREDPSEGQAGTPASAASRASAPTEPATDPIPTAGASRKVIDEIVVTATRREANTQDVPIAVTTLGAEAIDGREIRTVGDLQFQVPGLVYGQSAGQAQITMRGVGTQLQNISIEPGVAIYIDGVYQGRPLLSTSAMYDVERIEVLRGPQGTLFGRNATGGLIHFITARPSEELVVDGSFLGGSWETLRGRASVSGPILDGVLTGRFSVVGERNDGWLPNLTKGTLLNDRRLGSIKGGLDWFPLDDVEVRVLADFQAEEFGGTVLQALTGNVFSGDLSNAEGIGAIASLFGPFADQAFPVVEQLTADGPVIFPGRWSENPREIYSDVDTFTDTLFGGIALDTTVDLGFFDVRGIGAYRESAVDGSFDVDGTDANGGRADRTATAHQLSGEVHLFSNFGGWIDWLVGGYLYQEEAFEADPVFFFATADDPDGLATLDFFGTQDTLSLAGFSEVTAALLWDVSLTVGGRYTVDDKTFVETSTTRFAGQEEDNCRDLRTNETWSEFTPKIGLQWTGAEELLIYGTWSKGFKAGGLNLSGCGDTYDPELLDAWESGIKSQWLGNTLRANLAGFYYDYQDYQNLRLEDLREVVTNAQDAKVHGAEVELLYSPVEWLSVSGAGSWLEAKFVKFREEDPFDPLGGEKDLSGNRLPRSPRFSVNVGVDGFLPVRDWLVVSPRVEWNWVDEYFFTAFNRAESGQGSFHLLNAYVNLFRPAEDFFLRGFVKNVTDVAVLEFAIESGELFGIFGGYSPPRMWGIEAGFRL